MVLRTGTRFGRRRWAPHRAPRPPSKRPPLPPARRCGAYSGFWLAKNSASFGWDRAILAMTFGDRGTRRSGLLFLASSASKISGSPPASSSARSSRSRCGLSAAMACSCARRSGGDDRESSRRGGGDGTLKIEYHRGSLSGGTKSVPEQQFCKKTACISYFQTWLVAIGGGWRLAVGGGWWWLATVGGSRLVAAGGWGRLAIGDWRLAVGGSWSLAVGGPLGRSLRAVLNKKKNLVPYGPPCHKWTLKFVCQNGPTRFSQR